MSTNTDLFSNTSKTKSALDSNRLVSKPYASVFWRCDRASDGTEAKIIIGWSMPLGFQEFRSGSIIFRTKLGEADGSHEDYLPFVEEPLGIVHHTPTPGEEKWNAHLERLVADYLLFFVHRVLFGQCRKMWDQLTGKRLAGEPDVLDEVLIFGPTLPKFRGRLCYSHFKRIKTVAILAPECALGRLPGQSTGPWRDEPIPAFWHDCSARRWFAPNAESIANNSEMRLSSFDLIVPTGDGLSGRLISELPRAATLWREKATLIQNLLDQDRESVRLALWQNSEVFLPRGVARATRAAILGDSLFAAIARRKAIYDQASAADRKHYGEIENKIQLRGEISGPEGETTGLRALVFCKAVDIGQIGRKPENISKARRDTRSPEDLVSTALTSIKEEVGEYIFSK